MKCIYQRTVFMLVFLLGGTMAGVSQNADEEYRLELGAALGGCFYMGDANYSTLFKNMEMMAGVIVRFNVNPRMSVKCNVAMGKISGETKSLENVFPQNLQTEFERTLYDVGAQFEYNFWPYGHGLSYRESRKFTPYILGGLGVTYAPEPMKDVFTMNFPVGVGVKYKFAPRWNVGFEFSMRFSLSDALDVEQADGLKLDDPYGVESKGMKNKDSYSFVNLSVTYDLWPKCYNCNKD